MATLDVDQAIANVRNALEIPLFSRCELKIRNLFETEDNGSLVYEILLPKNNNDIDLASVLFEAYVAYYTRQSHKLSDDTIRAVFARKLNFRNPALLDASPEESRNARLLMAMYTNVWTPTWNVPEAAHLTDAVVQSYINGQPVADEKDIEELLDKFRDPGKRLKDTEIHALDALSTILARVQKRDPSKYVLASIVSNALNVLGTGKGTSDISPGVAHFIQLLTTSWEGFCLIPLHVGDPKNGHFLLAVLIDDGINRRFVYFLDPMEKGLGSVYAEPLKLFEKYNATNMGGFLEEKKQNAAECAFLTLYLMDYVYGQLSNVSINQYLKAMEAIVTNFDNESLQTPNYIAIKANKWADDILKTSAWKLASSFLTTGSIEYVSSMEAADTLYNDILKDPSGELLSEISDTIINALNIQLYIDALESDLKATPSVKFIVRLLVLVYYHDTTDSAVSNFLRLWFNEVRRTHDLWKTLAADAHRLEKVFAKNQSIEFTEIGTMLYDRDLLGRPLVDGYGDTVSMLWPSLFLPADVTKVERVAKWIANRVYGQSSNFIAGVLYKKDLLTQLDTGGFSDNYVTIGVYSTYDDGTLDGMDPIKLADLINDSVRLVDDFEKREQQYFTTSDAVLANAVANIPHDPFTLTWYNIIRHIAFPDKPRADLVETLRIAIAAPTEKHWENVRLALGPVISSKQVPSYLVKILEQHIDDELDRLGRVHVPLPVPVPIPSREHIITDTEIRQIAETEAAMYLNPAIEKDDGTINLANDGDAYMFTHGYNPAYRQQVFNTTRDFMEWQRELALNREKDRQEWNKFYAPYFY